MLIFKPTTQDIWRGQITSLIGGLLGIVIFLALLPIHENISIVFIFIAIAFAILWQATLSAVHIEELKEFTTIVVEQNILEGPSGVTLFSSRAKIDISQIVKIDDKLPRWFWPHRIATTDKSVYIYHHFSNEVAQQIMSMIKEGKN